MSSQKPQGSKQYLPFVIIGVVLLAVAAAAFTMLRSDGSDTTAQNGNASNSASSNSLSSAPPSATKRAGEPGAQPPHEKGGENAAVVLEEFGDYQCPPCGTIHPVLQKIDDDYGDRVRVVFRNYPLQTIHKNAFTAARAAEAAALQGKFWQMHDLIYKNQKEWSDSTEPRPIFSSYASRINLDVEKFKADIENPTVTSRIIADVARASALGVKGTPTIFLNGRELTVEKTLSEPKLRAEIDAALGAGKAQ
jgi:protein-disulfide isomerase